MLRSPPVRCTARLYPDRPGYNRAGYIRTDPDIIEPDISGPTRIYSRAGRSRVHTVLPLCVLADRDLAARESPCDGLPKGVAARDRHVQDERRKSDSRGSASVQFRTRSQQAAAWRRTPSPLTHLSWPGHTTNANVPCLIIERNSLLTRTNFITSILEMSLVERMYVNKSY